ncbi:hypothetical protein O9992_26750 [Vibrio lentus]|nr:hypothetical protein [Vibrio lentus]
MQSHQAQAEELLLLVSYFLSGSRNENNVPSSKAIGLSAEKVQVTTFHQLGLKIRISLKPNVRALSLH